MADEAEVDRDPTHTSWGADAGALAHVDAGTRIGRFEVRARLGAGATGTVFLVHDDQLGRLAAVKVLHAQGIDDAAHARLLREARGLARLSHPNVVQVYEVGEHEGAPFIAMEYVRGRTLRAHIDALDGSWRERVDVLLQGARGLEAAHEAGLVHRDFKPSNVMIGADGRVRVLDFGLVRESREPTPPAAPATFAPDASADLTASGAVVGTPAYMAPEQLRGEPCTARTDQFSFAVVAFELLYGARPYGGSSLAELKTRWAGGPPRIPEVSPAPPRALEQVILRSLAASPSARWASMAELAQRLGEIAAEADLRAYLGARRGVAEHGASEDAPVHGHEAHLEVLRRRFVEVLSPDAGPALVVVSGEAGIGKSSLVRRALRDALPATAWVGEAKLSLLKMDNPLTAFFAALDSLAAALDEERPSGARARRRAAITAAVGPSLSALFEVCPSLQRYVGAAAPPSPLEGRAQRNRQRYVTERFIAAVRAPVVLCFDDLQWADDDCVGLVEDLLAADDVGPLTIVVGYRRGEGAPADRRLEALVRGPGARTHVELEPLDLDAIQAMLVGDVGLRADLAPEVALRLRDKTGGNPFRIQQLLRELRGDGSLRFDPEHGAFTCDVPSIAIRPLDLDVADLLARRLSALSSTTRDALQLLACAGDTIALSALADARGEPPPTLLRALWPAIAAGLVRVDGGADLESDPGQVKNAQLRFLHDRIQQAALDQLDERARTRAHRTIGRSLLATHGPNVDGPALFALTDQLNLGRSLAADDAERAMLVELNLRSGATSMAAAAYPAAARYFEIADGLADDVDDDARRHAILCALGRARALASDDPGAREALERALRHARTDAERMAAYRIALESAMLASDYRAGAVAVRAALGMHGLALPDGEAHAMELLDAHTVRLEARLADLDVASLADVPEIADPWVGSLHDILGRFTVLAYRSSRPAMMGWAVVALSTESLSARSSHAGYAFAAYAFMLAGRGEYERARSLADVGLELARRAGDPVVLARTTIVAHALIGHYYAPLVELAEPLAEAYPACLEAGELVHASDLVLFADYLRLTGGMPLDELAPLVETHLRFFRRFAPTPLEFFYRPHVAYLLDALSGRSLTTFDPTRFVAKHGDSPAATAWYLSARVKLDVLFEEHAPVPELLERVAVVERATQGQMHVPETRGYASLSLLDPARSLDDATARDVRARVARWQVKLSRFAAQLPANFAPLHAIVEAELARQRGDDLGATIDRYEHAIAEAGRARALDKEALAHHLCARFWSRRGNHATASAHLRLALDLYARWGARRVVEALT